MIDTPGSAARVPLGRSGLAVAPLGWGMWRFTGGDVAGARERIDAALEAGCTLFDTADIYGLGTVGGFGAAEVLLGQVLRQAPAIRQQIVLATKAGIEPGVPYNSSADYLVGACEASLRRLGVDHVDLLQVHRPDLLAHPEEVARAFDRLYRQGKIRAAGVSNYTAAQTRALLGYLAMPLASLQPEYSPLALEPLSDGILDLALERGIAVLAWSPLAQGRLAGAAGDARSTRVVAALDLIAARAGVTRAAVAYAWVMAHPTRPVPLVGAQSPPHIREAATALRVGLTRADWYRVLEASRGEPMP
jgi:aryl-alcohol dehydrogenase-like predicted oxidoreductase